MPIRSGSMPPRIDLRAADARPSRSLRTAAAAGEARVSRPRSSPPRRRANWPAWCCWIRRICRRRKRAGAAGITAATARRWRNAAVHAARRAELRWIGSAAGAAMARPSRCGAGLRATFHEAGHILGSASVAAARRRRTARPGPCCFPAISAARGSPLLNPPAPPARGRCRGDGDHLRRPAAPVVSRTRWRNS